LNEEDSSNLGLDENYSTSNESELDFYNLPKLSENTISSLLEQAKSEGLYPVVETNRSDSSK
jgi:hypothetical protein